MKRLAKLFRTAVVLLAGVLLGSSVIAQPQALGLERAAAVKAARVAQLLGMQGVVGAGVGLDNAGLGAVHILVMDNAAAARMPRALDGVPVVALVTGEIRALGARDVVAAAPPADKKSVKIDPTAVFPRPVPIGVSTGIAQPGEICSAGTIGCRVKGAGGTLYALSNNHVYALENEAESGWPVAQPGPYDTGCLVSEDYRIGALNDFIPLVFSGAANFVDAAIAETTADDVDNATPANGYGLPKSVPVGAFVGQAVQKYGRTTGLTKGTVSTVDATVSVGYGSGTALFYDQIVVFSRKAFLKSGDSGSLVVTNPGRSPVGLLFAGTATGQYGIANRIAAVLEAFEVTIDGEE